ncbi:MAG: hypothetical protein WD342_00720 [Verrucomicrobiales bacterium]
MKKFKTDTSAFHLFATGFIPENDRALLISAVDRPRETEWFAENYVLRPGRDFTADRMHYHFDPTRHPDLNFDVVPSLQSELERGIDLACHRLQAQIFEETPEVLRGIGPLSDWMNGPLEFGWMVSYCLHHPMADTLRTIHSETRCAALKEALEKLLSIEGITLEAY